jgi:hypothetical protein
MVILRFDVPYQPSGVVLMKRKAIIATHQRMLSPMIRVRTGRIVAPRHRQMAAPMTVTSSASG